MQTVIAIADRGLPRALVESAEFVGLAERDRQQFASRLRYVEEIPAKIEEWAQHADKWAETKALTDRVELDLMINLGSHQNDSRPVSTWLLHSSWTFETSPRRMRDAMRPELLEGLCQADVGVDASREEFLRWATRLAALLAHFLDEFYDARSFDGVMGNLIGLDLCLAHMYRGLIAQRLNPRIL